MKVAINGAGIAGTTLAFWLRRAGHQVTLIERAPRFRTGGYIIDFWGLGYTVAERMGIIDAVRSAGYSIREVRIVNKHGHRVGGFSSDLLSDALNGRYTSIRRGDLAAEIYRAVQALGVETLFDNTVTHIQEHETGLRVSFERGEPRDFDLLVGADGLHSQVRELAFGPQQRYEKPLGAHVAAFELAGYRPREPLVYTLYTEPKRQAARFAERGDNTLILLIFRDELIDPSQWRTDDSKTLLHHVFDQSGWECQKILAGADGLEDIYFDSASQIRMSAWSDGRVVLLGDAAAAVSLLAGEGTGLAMIEAYVLAGELKRAGGDYREAFSGYERRLRAFVEAKQASAEKTASFFVPRNRWKIWLRNQATRLSSLPFVARIFIDRTVRDDLSLPDYDM